MHEKKIKYNKITVKSGFSVISYLQTRVLFLWIILIWLCTVFPSILWAQADVTVTGYWALNITAADISGGPGSPLNDTYESLIDQILIEIGGRRVFDWIVYVRRSDVIWNSDFCLNIKRTGEGQGGGTVTGGTAYQEITTVDTEYLQGSKKLKNIPNQLQLKLLSGVVDSRTYQTTVIYTVIDL
ncbi:MAG: hypothetical protein R6V04_03515 [bacterium]